MASTVLHALTKNSRLELFVLSMRRSGELVKTAPWHGAQTEKNREKSTSKKFAGLTKNVNKSFCTAFKRIKRCLKALHSSLRCCHAYTFFYCGKICLFHSSSQLRKNYLHNTISIENTELLLFFSFWVWYVFLDVQQLSPMILESLLVFPDSSVPLRGGWVIPKSNHHDNLCHNAKFHQSRPRSHKRSFFYFLFFFIILFVWREGRSVRREWRVEVGGKELGGDGKKLSIRSVKDLCCQRCFTAKTNPASPTQ